VDKTHRDVEEYYDTRVPYYVARLKDSQNQARYQYMKLIIDSLKNKRGKALDVGCAIGVFSKYLAEAGFMVTAIDISSKLIEAAQKHSAHPNVTYMHKNALNFDSDEKFDLILFADVLEHIAERDVFMIVKRITKYNSHEDTAIIVELPDANFIKFMDEHYPDKLQIIDNGYPIDHIVTMFEYCDFIPVRMSVFGIDTDVQYNRYLFAHKKALEAHYVKELKRVYGK